MHETTLQLEEVCFSSEIYILKNMTFICIKGLDTNASIIALNTVYMGKCYLITSYKKSANTSQLKDSPANIRNTTYIRISLLTIDSTANIYVTPEESHIGVILDTWNRPIKTFNVRNGIFMEWAMRKEFRARKSTMGSPCNYELTERDFYQVKYYFFT